jgi:hypothetical protein
MRDKTFLADFMCFPLSLAIADPISTRLEFPIQRQAGRRGHEHPPELFRAETSGRGVAMPGSGY